MKNFIALMLVSVFVLASCSSTENADMNTDDNMDMNQDTSDMNTDDMGEMGTDEGVMVGGAMMVPELDIVENAMNADNVTTLVTAVSEAGLVDTLKSEGPFTVFAPTNDAFAMLPEGAVEELLLPENRDQLTSLLTYHVVPGAYTSADLEDGMMLTTVQGQELEVTYEDNVWYVNGVMIEIADVISSNGVTFVISEVLTPAQ